jgi:hypothetical protein
MVRFLRICAPLDNPENFKRLLLRPLKNADPSGTEILRVRTRRSAPRGSLTHGDQALMAQICMRRTKEVRPLKMSARLSFCTDHILDARRRRQSSRSASACRDDCRSCDLASRGQGMSST